MYPMTNPLSPSPSPSKNSTTAADTGTAPRTYEELEPESNQREARLHGLVYVGTEDPPRKRAASAALEDCGPAARDLAGD